IRNTLIKREDLDCYSALDAIELTALQKQIGEPRNILPYFDFVVFRKSPLIELSDGSLLCVDPAFLLEKLSAGFYWTIINSLPEQDRRPAFQAFGYLFEAYVDEVLGGIYPRNRYISFADFEKKNEEAFDGIILCPGNHLIVLEYKGSFLTIEAKYSGKVKNLERDLDK